MFNVSLDLRFDHCLLPLTEMSHSVVPTLCTLSTAGVTDVSVAVTLTRGAAGETPLSWLTV